nr:ribonuclease H-like domain-containing protein [Tanacetum cinerariifolium]
MGELTFFLGLQVKQSEEEIFISQDKYLDEILKKFDFSYVKTASTPIETQKPLVKDEEAADVDVYLYRSMIGSLMYLTASRPDIMFLVCACSRRLISWQCKKQTIVATSTTKAEYVAANCCRQATLNEPTPQGEGSGSGLGRQKPWEVQWLRLDLRVHLYSLLIHLSQKVFDLENVKTAQAKKIASLKKRVTKLEQKQSLRILCFHPFRAGSSKRDSLGRRKVSKQRRKNLKSQKMFQDIDDVLDEDVDTEMIVEDKGNGEKGDSTAEIVSTARPDISAARPEVSTAEPKTPPTTATLFDDEDVTIVDTLTKKKEQDQIKREAEVALKIQVHLDEKARTKRERQKEASKAALAEMYDELAKERAEAIRSKPPTKTQLRNLMMTYLKHTGSEEDEKRIRSRKKRVAGTSSKHKSPKKKKVNDQESKDSDKEHRKCLKMVLDDDKVIHYETLDVKSPIIDYESQLLGTNEAGDVHVYKLTRLDRSYRYFSTFSRMLEVLDRQDVLDLHKIIMESFQLMIQKRNQQDWKLLSWKLYETCGVHTLMLDDSLVSVNMFIEKRLKKSKVFGYILLVIMKLILKKLDFYLVKIKFRGGLLRFMLFGNFIMMTLVLLVFILFHSFIHFVSSNQESQHVSYSYLGHTYGYVALLSAQQMPHVEHFVGQSGPIGTPRHETLLLNASNVMTLQDLTSSNYNMDTCSSQQELPPNATPQTYTHQSSTNETPQSQPIYGTLSRYEARLVPNGNTQLEGIDVDETFSLVVKPEMVYMHQPSRFWDSAHPDYQIFALLHQELSLTDLGSLNYFLGIFVTRDSLRIFLSQRKYATDILDQSHMVNCNPSRTPIDTESKSGDDGDPVCLYMHDPREPHLSALKQILRYVRGTLDHGLQLFSSFTTSLVTYSDCPTTRRSTSGYCVFLGNNLLSWSSKRQPTLSQSSADVEYRSVANVVADTGLLRNLLRE